MPSRDSEIRCICSRHPLLAVFGRDKEGKLFIHIKVYKQARIFAEVFIGADAEVKLRCRECLRMHKIKIVSGRPLLQEEKEAMDSLQPDPSTPDIDRTRPRP